MDNWGSRKRFKADLPEIIMSESHERKTQNCGRKESEALTSKNLETDILAEPQGSDTEKMDIDGQIPDVIPLPYLPLSSSSNTQLIPRIDESTNFGGGNLMDRFIKLVDELDNHVEKLRKDAITLQEKRDYLSMSMDLLKNNDLLSNLQESQEECLHQVNVFIDSLISSPDAVISRQRCQMFLNACDGAPEAASGTSRDPCELTVDKKFESSLLGCTLDDQKTIKKRLHALITYLNKQTISD
uniref:Putative bag family molecular chaperone regulator 2 isoform x2 n=1 Tax=Lutzomyia longipalpis TaxID=7200 RepID=A0A1B0C9P3_LUTLO